MQSHPTRVTDVLGFRHVFDEPPKRVVSLVPSLTETLFDLGAGASLVGITDFCIFPEGVDVPRVGGTKNPRVDQIERLEPDLVYVNVEENLRKHADQIAAFAPIFATEPKDVDGVRALIETLGAIHGCAGAASSLVAQLDEARREAAHPPFTFACAIWKEPWMWCGGDTYVSDLVSSAGGVNVLADRRRYPAVTLDEVATLKPQVVFLPDEPYVFTEDDADSVAEVMDGARVVGPFPGHLFTWHGVRTIDGLRFLATAI